MVCEAKEMKKEGKLTKRQQKLLDAIDSNMVKELEPYLIKKERPTKIK